MPKREDELLDKQIDDLAEMARPWWSRYSRHGELPWSTAASMVVHVLLLVLIVLGSVKLASHDPQPPAVSVTEVGDEPDAAPGEGPDEPTAEPGVEATPVEPTMPAIPNQTSLPEIENVSKPDEPKVELPVSDTGTIVDQTQQDLQKQEARIKQASDLRRQLQQNLKNQSGKKGGGAGGTGGTGRASRPARWILLFKSISTQDYLSQIDGLGAVIAFPESGDKWRYCYNASSPSRRWETRPLGGENRLYWINEKQATIAAVASYLGVPNVPLMVMFLPEELEQRMLQMELAHQNLSEDQIRSTQFEVIASGGKYDVKIVKQIPR